MLDTYTPRFMAVRAAYYLPFTDDGEVDENLVNELSKHIRTTHNVNVIETDEGLEIGNASDSYERSLLAWGDYFVEFENNDGSTGWEIMIKMALEAAGIPVKRLGE